MTTSYAHGVVHVTGSPVTVLNIHSNLEFAEIGL